MLCCSFQSVRGQVDPHFSQYYAYPLYLNPALTAISDVEYRVTAIHRNQWNSAGKPFLTTGVSVDISTTKNLNFGLNFLNQTAGTGGYRYVNSYFSIAYTGIQLDDYGFQRIVFGLQGGIISRRFDPSKLEFGDQWKPYLGFDPGTASSEIFNRTSATAFDAAAGVVYYDGDPEKKVNIFAGYSANHLTEPEDPFLPGQKYKLPLRSTLHAGARVQVNETFAVVPNAIFMSQGNATETMIGAYAEFRANDEVDVMAGVNYRINDAIAPFFGLNYGNMAFGFSYDVNASSLGRLTTKPNSFEMSVTFTGRSQTNTGYFRCPKF
jgi:type IX secretion system PorP/SprF family membrane protein